MIKARKSPNNASNAFIKSLQGFFRGKARKILVKWPFKLRLVRGYQKTGLPCSLTTEYTSGKYVAVIACIAGEQRFPGEAPKGGAFPRGKDSGAVLRKSDDR
jgi:hypothetical protein